MTTSLVTGGAGFIGSHVADHLLKMGHRVVILDDLSGGSRDNLPDPRGYSTKDRQWDFWNYSILDLDAIEQAFHLEELAGHPIDYVFHLAAYAAEGLSHYIRRYNYETNVIGSINLINAAVNYGVKRFVFASSVAVYGLKADGANEFQIPTPIDPYGIAKWTVEQDLFAAAKLFGLPFTIFRPGNVYGPRQNLNDGYRNAIGIFIRQSLKGEPMTVYGDGEQKRQFTYIDDVAPNIARCVEFPRTENQIYNIGADLLYSVHQISDMVVGALGKKSNIVYLPQRFEAHTIRVDHTRIDCVYGITWKTPPSEGIPLMAEWAKTQALDDPKPFTDIEIQKGLPEHWRQLNNPDVT